MHDSATAVRACIQAVTHLQRHITSASSTSESKRVAAEGDAPLLLPLLDDADVTAHVRDMLTNKHGVMATVTSIHVIMDGVRRCWRHGVAMHLPTETNWRTVMAVQIQYQYPTSTAAIRQRVAYVTITKDAQRIRLQRYAAMVRSTRSCNDLHYWLCSSSM